VTVGSLVLIYLFWSGHIQVWHVYCIVFVRAMGGIFQWSAMQASISLMVPQAHLARIAGLNQALRGATSIAAPAMGAFLLQALPMYGVLAVDVLTALMAIVPLMVVRIPQPVHAQAPSGSAVRTLLTDVWAGMRYLIAWPALLMLMLMAMLINFLFPPTDTLLPLLITQHFKGDVWHLGLIQSAFGGGVVAGGLLLSVWGGFSRRIYTTLFGLIGMSVGILLVGVAPANGFLLAVAGMMLCGVMMPITNGPVQAIIQARVAPEMQGRIFMLLESMATAMMPLSMLAAGPISDWLGIRIWYLLGGAGTLLMGIGAFFVPLILNIEHDSAPAIRAAAQPADLPPCPDCAH
jgi:DHA3 family macrolide efflux protein-like MFS transporter